MSFKCFESNQELKDAVAAYVADNGPDTETALTYGHPINAWCTTGLADFSGVFADASTFNEELNSWDTSSATTMAGMFRNAVRFNETIDDWDTSAVTDLSGST
jgi:surface protein